MPQGTQQGDRQLAYVRQRGNQLAIVHGQRDPGSGKVEQHILFTLYSKAEALEALGRSNKEAGWRFEQLLERQYPGISFPWKQIRKAIASNLDVLPDLYQYRETRLRSHFRRDLLALVRQLLLADPQELDVAAELLAEHRDELRYLKDLIEWRIKLARPRRSKWTGDNAFLWRFALRGSEVPPEAEEHAVAFFERREFDLARAAFGLLVECFENYADGYNYLGLIDLDQGKLDEAIGHFEQTVEVGRRLFPKHIGKKRYWSDLATRPFMRGLMNLAQTFNQVGRYDEALTLCDRLENECGDDITGRVYRASVYLNLGRWQNAADAALSLLAIFPSQSLVAAFAFFELGRPKDALAHFLNGALNGPRAAKMLAGELTNAPTSGDEIEDHNAGVGLKRELRAYLDGPGRSARSYFTAVLRLATVRALLDEIEEVVQRWRTEHRTGKRDAFDRMHVMRTPEFASGRASEIALLVGKPRERHRARSAFR